MCTVQKNSKCTQSKPSKWFKTRDSLVTHGKKYHSREIPLLDCPKCDKQLGSQVALEKHTDWHKKIEILERREKQKIELQKSVKEVAKRKIFARK